MSVLSEYKKRAIEFRKQGKSVSEIKQEIPVARSTLSLWLRHVPISDIARARIERRSHEGYKKSLQTRRKKAQTLFDFYLRESHDAVGSVVLNKNLRRLLAALLYYCEGEKTQHVGVRFTNSDPDLIKLFLNLLRESFNLDETKFRVCMHLHEYHEEKQMLSFWSHVTSIPSKQFLKTFQKKNTGKTLREGYNGCVSVRYNDTAITKQLLAFAEAFFSKQQERGA